MAEQRDLLVTRGEYIADAKMVSKALLQLGIKKGDIITIMMPNLYQSLVIFKAANRIGAITTFLNENTSEEELRAYLDLYQSPLLVTYNQDQYYAREITKNTPLQYVINVAKEYVDSRWQANFPEMKNHMVQYHHLECFAKY